MAEFSLELLPHIPRKVKRQAVTWNRTQDTWLLQPVLCHWATTAGQQPALTILYTVCRLVRLVLQLTVCLRETKTTLCMVSPLSMHSCVIFVKNTSYTFLTLSFLQTKGKAFQEQVLKQTSARPRVAPPLYACAVRYFRRPGIYLVPKPHPASSLGLGMRQLVSRGNGVWLHETTVPVLWTSTSNCRSVDILCILINAARHRPIKF